MVVAHWPIDRWSARPHTARFACASRNSAAGQRAHHKQHLHWHRGTSSTVRESERRGELPNPWRRRYICLPSDDVTERWGNRHRTSGVCFRGSTTFWSGCADVWVTGFTKKTLCILAARLWLKGTPCACSGWWRSQRLNFSLEQSCKWLCLNLRLESRVPFFVLPRLRILQ